MWQRFVRFHTTPTADVSVSDDIETSGNMVSAAACVACFISDLECARGGFAYLSSHTRLTMPCCQGLLNERSSRSAGDATDGEEDPTCRVSSSGNNITQQTLGAHRPVRNRSWAPPRARRDATPSTISQDHDVYQSVLQAPFSCNSAVRSHARGKTGDMGWLRATLGVV